MTEWHFSLSKIHNLTSFIVACDVNEEGAKKFASFKSINSFEFFYENQTTKNYYEVICSDSKSKLYIDLDLHNVTLLDSQKILQKILHQLDSFCLIFCDTSPHCNISESHSEIKKSFHLISDNICFENQKQRSLFSEEFHKFLSHDLKPFFDSSVYSKNRCFRLLGSSKFGQQRPLVPTSSSSSSLSDHCVFLEPFSHNDCTQLHFEQIQFCDNLKITNTPENIDKLLNSIDLQFWTKRSSWVQLAAAMKNAGLSFDSFDSFSQKCNK